MLNINFTPFPEIETDRLLLRQIKSEDVQDIYLLRSDKRVSEFIFRKLCKSREDALTFINNCTERIITNESVIWAVCPKELNKLAGTICLWNILKEHHRCEIGFEIFPEYQGKGLMSEAAEKIISYGFSIMNLHSIEAEVSPGNLRSVKLLEKFNFKKEGQFSDYIFYEGKFHDLAVYSLINKNKDIHK